MSDIVLYTDSFPYYNSETFLETEIQYLSKIFDIIFIQPLNGNGNMRVVPVNVRVLEPVGAKRCSKIIMYAYGFLNFHLLLSEKSLRRNLRSVSLFKALKYIGFGCWIKHKIMNNLITGETVHYSYWLNFSAFALALLQCEGKISMSVSRAHRFDLYSGKNEVALDFLKLFTIKYLKKLYLISENGYAFIKNLYPEYLQKYSISRLGTLDPGFISAQNNKDNLVIVSCSNLKPIKRVHLILNALILINQTHPELVVKWFHIGDGDNLDQLLKSAEDKLRRTLIKCKFKGHYTNSDIMDFYHNQPVDVFLNVSETEGIPVSIMEAQSFGIPVIATSVGGTPEIVNNVNGMLLNVDLLPEDLAEILYAVYRDKESWNKKRSLSRKNWELNFDAEINYGSFGLELAGSRKTLL